jgi:hypothetical protein
MNTDRIYQGDDDLWYFNVRGNQPKGPFTVYQDAEGALNEHLRRCRRPTGASLWPKPLRGLKIRRTEVAESHHP